MTDILIIEDNHELGTLLCDFIRRESLSVFLCEDGESAAEIIKNQKFRIILLDIMLPGMNGFETCSFIRSVTDTPVIMMSARTDDDSKISGYNTGADDYIEKPFSIPVLMAKIKSLLRRNSSDSQQTEVLSSCGIKLYPSVRKVMLGDEEISVTGKSFDILMYLMKNEGIILDKDRIFNEIWGSDCFSEPSTLNVHIRWLRENLHQRNTA